MRWLLSLLLASSTAATAAAAAGVGSLTESLERDVRFADGTAKMRKLDYEAALSTFEALLKDTRPDDERVTLLLYAGSARALLGDDGGARLAFEAALRIDDRATIGFKTSPKVLALFDEVRASLPPPAPKDAVDPPPRDARDTRDTRDARDTRDSPPMTTTTTTDPPAPPKDDAEPHAPRDPERPAATTTTTTTMTTHPSSAPSSRRGSTEPAGPTVVDVVGVGAGVIAAGAVIGAGAFAFDAAGKMQIADDRSTSQQEAQELVDRANTSLTFAALLGAIAVVSAGTAAACLLQDSLWPNAPQELASGADREGDL